MSPHPTTSGTGATPPAYTNAQLLARLSSAIQQLKAKDDKIGELSERLNGAWEALGERVCQVERLEKEMEAVRKEGQKKIDRVHGEKGQLMKEKRVADEKVTTLQADKLELQLKVMSLTGLVSLHNTLDLDTQVEELEGDVEELEADVEQLQATVSQLETKVESLETENEVLRARNADWESECAPLAADNKGLHEKNARSERAAALYKQKVPEHKITIGEQ